MELEARAAINEFENQCTRHASIAPQLLFTLFALLLCISQHCTTTPIFQHPQHQQPPGNRLSQLFYSIKTHLT